MIHIPFKDLALGLDRPPGNIQSLKINGYEYQINSVVYDSQKGYIALCTSLESDKRGEMSQIIIPNLECEKNE